jgi:DNA-binding transcriptional LysR family regulator
VRQGAETVRFAPPVTHQIGDGEVMILAATAGAGLCQMPQPVQRGYRCGTTGWGIGDYEPEPVDVHAVWPKVSHLRPKVRYVVDELVKVFEGWQ